jgi:thiosulfate reductase/polysulfide reductase chain A
VVTRDPVVPALFESRPMLEIVTGLAQRLNLGEFFDFTMEQYRRQQFEKLPGALAALEKDGVYYNHDKLYGVYEGKVFKTMSKKIELYNQRYADLGLDPMPVYRPPRKVGQDKFRLVVGRDAYITQGSTTNNALLFELEPENTLWLHPASAEKLSIRPDDRVEVASSVGKGQLKVRLTKEIRPDTVYMATGFGVLSRGLSNVYGKGACIAEVLEDYADEISGNMAMHETMVTITKV